MTLRYADTENETKTLTEPGWKADLVRAYFKQNGFKDAKEAKAMLLRMGWTLKIKPIKNGAGKRCKVQVLNPKGETILRFETDN